MVFTGTFITSRIVVLSTMSNYSSPISVAFEFQRSALEGTHDAIENSVTAQKQFNNAVFGGFDPARNVSEQSTDLVRTGVDTYFEAIESVVPAGSGFEELHGMMHEQLDMLEESQLDAIDQLETGLHESADSTEQFLDEFLAALDEQVATLLETHDDLEAQTVHALEDLETGIEELQTEFESQGEEIQAQLESQAEAIQEQLEEVTENIQQAASEPAELSA